MCSYRLEALFSLFLLLEYKRNPISRIMDNKKTVSEVLPKAGLVYSEKSTLSEILCKPKIMPLKSMTLEKIEAMEREAQEIQRPRTSQEQQTLKNF